MNSRPGCQARIIGDQYRCDKCGLVWDISDLDPPDCRTVFNVGTPGHIDHGSPSHTDHDSQSHDEEMNKMKEILKPEYCRHGVPMNSKCRNCDISYYKKRMENQ